MFRVANMYTYVLCQGQIMIIFHVMTTFLGHDNAPCDYAANALRAMG